MALWHRIGPTRLESLYRRCGRWRPVLPGAAGVPVSDPSGGHRAFWAVGNPAGAPPAHPCPGFVYSPVRSFAAPALAKSKPKPASDASSGPRINGAITAAYVRLVTEEGHGIVSRREALDRATRLNLDLVEVQRNANPPVCKIMDFHREKYKQEVKEKERAKSKSSAKLRNENKEVRFKAKTELKDLKVKADSVVRLMERGYRVKCSAMPTGKEDEDLGELLSRLLALIEDVSVVESGPHLDSRLAYVIVRHAKFMTKKSGKKASKVVDAVGRGVQRAVPSTSTAVGSISQEEASLQAEEEWEQVESSSETDSEAFSDQVNTDMQHHSDEPTTSLNKASDESITEEVGWSAFNATDNFDNMSNFDTKEKSIEPGFSGSTVSIGSHQKVAAASVVGVPTSKPGFSSLKGKLQQEKDQTEGPSVVASNRYSKHSEFKGRFPQTKFADRGGAIADTRAVLNQGRMPMGPTKIDSQGCEQTNPGQRQFHPNNQSPSPNYGIFSVPRTQTSGDQRRVGVSTMGKSGNLGPSQSSEVSSGPKTDDYGDQKCRVDAPIGESSSPGIRTPSFGIFSTHKTVPFGDQRKSVDETKDKPQNTPLTPKHEIFSAMRPASSSDQTNSADAITEKASVPSSPPRRYGIFSSR